jgi:uracil phosphoribosyltransferase
MNIKKPETTKILSNILNQHASMVAFNFLTQTIALVFVLMIPITLLLKTVEIKTSLGDAH